MWFPTGAEETSDSLKEFSVESLKAEEGKSDEEKETQKHHKPKTRGGLVSYSLEGRGEGESESEE